MSRDYDEEGFSALQIGVAIVAIIGVVIGIGALIGLVGAFTTTDGGTIAVIRNGGWFDNRQVRQVVQPGSSITYTGMWSDEHDYPAAQRNFKISATPDADSNEVVTVPTKDGFSLGVTGTFYFELTRDAQALAAFDNAFGTRTYPVIKDGRPTGDSAHAYDGEDGWNGFLAFTMGNLVQNTLRQQISSHPCSDLYASCSLATGAQAAANVDNAANIQAVQDAVNASFAQDVKSSLGGDFFVNTKFVLSSVKLTDQVQQSIDAAQAAGANAAKAQNDLRAAQVEAQTNEAKQAGYNACPTCADIDRIKALPPGLTTYAPGSQFAVTK